MANEYLQFAGVAKSFPGVRALDGVSFGVREGSVHALMGENGAGKSTLLKILSGVYKPDGGSIVLNGKPQQFSSTADAISKRVAVIYQELHLCPDLTVAENMFLGQYPNALGFIRRGTLIEKTRKAIAALGEDISPTTRLGSLSIGQRQMIEIAKALGRDAKVIAFDEPTSSLSSRETDKLFQLIAQLKAQGRVIMYVSHRMDEIYQTCDAATVLRDGKHVETFENLADVSRDTLVKRMVGRSISDVFNYSPRPKGEVVLEVKNVLGRGLTAPASFQVAAGEIVGLFGLVGAGRTELLQLIYGATKIRSGTVALNGRPVRIGSPRDAIRAGIVLCPEDRKKDGIVPVRSVMENLNLSGRRHFSALGMFIREGIERANAEKYVQQLAIKTPTLKQLIVNLSGGNQQKVILARWLCEKIKVILLDEPTRGIDVGAKAEIYSIIYKLAQQGIAVVVVSSELPEVMGVSDRLLVMRQGAIVTSLTRAEATPENVLQNALPISTTSLQEAV